MRNGRLGWLVVSLLMCVSVSAVAVAHPGDGIVVTPDGTIYFTDVVRKVIWKLSTDGTLSPAKRDRWTHSLFLAADGTLYYEREVQRGDAWLMSFWKMSPDGQHVRLIEPQLDGRQFGGGPFVVDDEGSVYYGNHPARERRALLMKRTPQGEVSVLTGLGTGELHQDGPRDRATIRIITAMTRGPQGAIYFTDRHHVRCVTDDGKVTTVVSGLLDEKPADPPQKRGPATTINRLYGLTVGKDGTIYVAYHSGRRVIRIDAQEKISTAYETSRPWAPVGVAVAGTTLYVLESGFEAGSDRHGPRVRRVDLTTGAVSTLTEVTK